MNPRTSAGHDIAHPSARRRVVSCGVTLVLALLAPLAALTPQATGVTRTAATATTLPALCPGAYFTPSKVYDFTGTGTAPLQETIGHAPADALHIVADHPGVTFNGYAALFNGNGILQLNQSNYNPGTGSFSICIRWAWADPFWDTDGYNLLNLGDNPGDANQKGFGKIMPGYGRADGVGGATTMQLLTHGSSARVPHTTVMNYNATTDRACMFLDGVKNDCIDVALGNVDLSNQPLAVGGKFERSPGLVGTDDIGQWTVYQVMLNK